MVIMVTVRRLYRAALGIALVLHALALSVLPLRGADAASIGVFQPAVAALYVLGIVGLLSAGLGVLGVRPLRQLVMPAVAVGGLAALAAQLWLADADLWPGVVLSAALPVLAIVDATVRPAAPPSRHPHWRQAADVLGVAFLAWIVTASFLWPWHRAWGTDATEWTVSLPGDRLPRTPALEIMHAVTIDAPPEAVWPWLVQIGQDRGGFYSYTWLERAFGARITNADRVNPDWQALRAGDHVYATQPGYLGGLFGDRPGWVVDRVEANRAQVLRNWGAFVLLPMPEGRTRFLIRSTISNPRIPAWLAAINFTAFELPHFIMQRKMMLGIKARAEQNAPIGRTYG
jgi:hypothetical protein